MTPIIQVQDLVKRYKKGTTNAVDGVSFDVQRGEFFALLGPNGAGKTTTISILTTTLSPTSGKITIAGNDVERESSAVRKKIGIIFQNPSLDMNLTAEENVRLHAIMYGVYGFRPSYRLMPKAYKDKVQELASVLGIDKDIFKPIKTFSGGMKRKLEIIRSLIHQPKVLFLDEPTTGLDPVSRRNLWDYLTTVRQQTDTTIFLTTHYLEEAEEADHICIIDHGKIRTIGTPAQLKQQFAATYLVIESDNNDTLQNELGIKHIPFERVNGHLRIPLRATAEAQPLLKQIETPLQGVEVHTQTLEDTYLAIVAQGE